MKYKLQLLVVGEYTRINLFYHSLNLQKRIHRPLPDSGYKDPASELYKATGANIYKLSSGPFKKYFALSTNCVQLADTITGSAGLDALSVKGVITPGNYYALLNNMFERKNTIVISRNFYK